MKQVARVSATEEIFDPLNSFILESGKDEPLPPQSKSSIEPKKTTQKRNEDNVSSSFVEEVLKVAEGTFSEKSSKSTNQPAALNKTTSNGGKKQNTYHEATQVQLLSGEYSVVSSMEAVVQIASFGELIGTIGMTNYRLLFLPHKQLPSYSGINTQIPLATIEKIEREKKKDAFTNGVVVLIQCKDCRSVRINFKSKGENGEYDIERVLSVLSAYAFPNNIRNVFAFTHKMKPLQDIEDSMDYWNEFARLGVFDMPLLRTTKMNQDFRLCPTYPQLLVVPHEISDFELSMVCAFRSGQRFPVLCWANKRSGATLWRSSQPKSGVSGSCAQDEKYLDCIARSFKYYQTKGNGSGRSKVVSQEPILYIVDCRSRTSAMANRAAGAGYETTNNYPSCKLDFYNISNIHAVRDSFKSLCQVVLNASATPSTDVYFSKQVEDTQWLSYLRTIIKASWETASFLSKGYPVLVHCSHGWDRTAQVCSLAQLLLDPYYRTFRGFVSLVQKEWCAYGHPFLMRCGHGFEKGSRSEDEVSPIFLQFLDCVYQVQKQVPYLFEFNNRFLLTIADHVYSCRFETFLFSSELERRDYDSKKQCSDIWSYLMSDTRSFLNPLYSSNNSTASSHHLPALGQLMRGVSLWSEYFLRYSPVMSLSIVPSSLASYLVQNGDCSDSNKDIADRFVPWVQSNHDIWEAALRREQSLVAQAQQEARNYQETIYNMMRYIKEKLNEEFSEDEASLFLNTATRRGGMRVSRSRSSNTVAELELGAGGAATDRNQNATPIKLNGNESELVEGEDTMKMDQDGYLAHDEGTESHLITPSIESFKSTASLFGAAIQGAISALNIDENSQENYSESQTKYNSDANRYQIPAMKDDGNHDSLFLV